MNVLRMTKHIRSLLMNVSVVVMFSVISYGCGRANESAVPVQTSRDVISTPIPEMTPTLTGPELDGTKMAGSATVDAPQHALETQVAEGTPGPVPTFIPVPTQHPPLWTPTLGITGECAQGNHQFNYGGCWAGIINNEYIFVDTGAFMADPTHGTLRVYTATIDLLTFGAKLDYVTPAEVGQIRPTQVVWPVMTLATMDINPTVYFAFNLTTRQWISATPGPLPSAIVSPMPSFWPLPTQ